MTADSTPKDPPAKEPRHRDTRLRFEQWARNPACSANTISAVHGVPMADVAKREGTKPTMGQSPFAIARGQTFEQSLFRGQAASLREALYRAGVLSVSEGRFADFRLRLQRGPFQSLDNALAATARFFEELARTPKPELELLSTIAAGAVVRIPGNMMLPEAILVIDVLVARPRDGQPELMIGEVKTYPDRGGYTDSMELATARAQAGVYVHGLRLVLQEVGLEGKIYVSDEGFLVLTRPGFNRPSVRAGESFRFQAERAARGFERLRAVADQLQGVTDREEVIQAVLSAEVTYDESCLSFCDRATTCYADAVRRGDPTALGHDVARFLGKTNLHRAIELIDGQAPATPSEVDLVRRLHEYGRGRIR